MNFDIHIFEGKVDVEVLDKWLNMLEGYFSVHSLFDRDKITFVLLKASPNVKDWCETYCEKRAKEPSLFTTAPSRKYFRDVVKKQYYPLGISEDKYIQWTTL